MSLVAAIHVAVLFAIAKSLGMTSITVEPVTEGRLLDEVRPPDDPPPPVDRNLRIETAGPVIPIPDLPPVTFEEDAITPPPDIDFRDPPPIGGSAVVEPQIVGVRQDPRSPLSKPPYSARMIREGNQGTIEIEVYVQPNGRVGDARVAKSTGFEELDLAALAEAKRNWRLLPATRDGVPVAQWHRLRVTFKLNER